MNDSSEKRGTEAPAARKNIFIHILIKWGGIFVGSLVALICIILVCATLYLTPTRLTNLINTKGSEYFNADIESHNARFTLWSTFPRFCLEIDSIRIRSHIPPSLPDGLRNKLPDDYTDLAYCGKIEGGINILSLLGGTIRLHDVSATGFSMNLVSVNDSIANYLILPPEGMSVPHIPRIAANRITMKNPGAITFRSIQSDFSGAVDLSEFKIIEKKHSDTYSATCNGKVSAVYRNIHLLDSFPVRLNGGLTLHFNPFSLRLNDYKIGLGNLNTSTGMRLTAGDNPNMDYFDFQTESFSLMKFLEYLPAELVGNISELDIDPTVTLSARLLKPYHFSSSAMPVLELRCHALQGDMSYTLQNGDTLSVSHSDMDAVFFFDGENPAKSTLSIPQLSVAGEGIKCTLSALVTDIMTSPDVVASLNVNTSIENLMRHFPQSDRLRMSGTLDADLSARFSLPSITAFQPDSIQLGGDVKLQNLRAVNSDMDFKLADLDLMFSLAENKKQQPIFNRRQINKDQKWLDMLNHTPTALTVNLPANVKTMLKKIDYNIELALGKGKLTMRHYPDPVLFGNSALGITNDRIDLHSFSFRSGPSSMKLSGQINGLHNFLTCNDGCVAPLDMTMKIDIDTLDINSLAKAYEDAVIAATGHAPTSADKITAVPSDSVAMLIPRNINARLHATAAKTLWTNLDFRNIRADINVAGGDAVVKNLHLNTSFANASAALNYSTSNIENLDLGADLNLSDINMKQIYAKFPTLVAAMPQIQNFTGILGASGKLNAQIYPNMAFDMNSLEADMGLSGRQLKLTQNKFIHKIVKMLGIINSDPIHIENLDVRACVHDNLLELYPFIFGFDRYRIQLVGLNNFAGDLDYHIAVIKSPVPVHFGININGHYSKPELSFGRAVWNERRSAEVSSLVSQSLSFNLVKEMRKYMTMFIHKAAQSTSGPTPSDNSKNYSK